ncbi:bZIP transcription factor 29-like [Zingiber officinale]|uniref:bZIP transcription factor 29-like n=1 Tax=Zingiber officinale TaxID=94328 RepID=UPI001C4D90DB|nr:bZIP transcription factor 29-like [Zingiber officinale]
MISIVTVIKPSKEDGTAANGDGIKEGNKCGSATANHFRSLSMESLMGKLQDTMTNTSSSEFNSTEMKKILANKKLAEMAETDSKRIKRILANRQSAARSKEKKLRFISELENKVQALQTEATILSEFILADYPSSAPGYVDYFMAHEQLLDQRGITALKCQNNELRICLKGMEQQGKLRDAINEALNAEQLEQQMNVELEQDS